MRKIQLTSLLVVLAAGTLAGQAANATAADGGAPVTPPATTTDSPSNPPATPTPPPTAAPTDTSTVEAKAKAVAAQQELPYDYRIGPGDTIQVMVWKEPEASGGGAVRPDGKITLPILKEVVVAGLKPMEAQDMLTEALKKYMADPDVTVMVTGINSLKIYAIGGLKHEGPIPYTYQMTIMQAISEAGGLTDYAKRDKIYVLRNENGKEKQLSFDYNKALRGQGGQANFRLFPGDTLVVPQ